MIDLNKMIDYATKLQLDVNKMIDCADKLQLELVNQKPDYVLIKALLGHLDDLESIFIVITPDDRIAYVNNAGCSALSTSYESIIGFSWFDNFIPQSNKDQQKQTFEKFMSGEINASKTCKNEILTSQGNIINVIWNSSVLRNIKDNTIIASFSQGKPSSTTDDLISHIHSLTEREIEVIIQFASGYNAKEISKNLDIQPKTVHTHKMNIYKKMNFSNHRDLVSYSIKAKLINIDHLTNLD